MKISRVFVAFAAQRVDLVGVERDALGEPVLLAGEQAGGDVAVEGHEADAEQGGRFAAGESLIVARHAGRLLECGGHDVTR